MKLFLKEILSERNISVNQLHKMTGISRTTLDPLSKEETVPTKTRIETLERICEKLELPLSRIVSFEESFNETYEIINTTFHKKDFIAPENEFREDLILKIKGPSNKTFYVLIIAKYHPEDYFEVDNKNLFSQLENLTTYTTKTLKDENRINMEFEAIYQAIFSKAMEYTGKHIFGSRGFTVLTAKNRVDITLKDSVDIAEIQESENFSLIIGNPNFIDFISSFITDFFELAKHESWLTPESFNREFFELTEEERYTPIKRNYFSASLMDNTDNKDYYIDIKIKV